MHYGYRIVEDMIDGLSNWMSEKGFASIDDFRGLSLPQVTEWKHLNLNYKIVARIDEAKCIGCDLCYIACWDGAHQCIHLDRVSGPVDGPVELHAKPAAIEAATRARIAVTPIPKLDAMPVPPRMAGTRHPWSAFRVWMRRNAWAAICARWFARWKTASPWSRSRRAQAGDVGRADGRGRLQAPRAHAALRRTNANGNPDSKRHGCHGGRRLSPPMS